MSSKKIQLSKLPFKSKAIIKSFTDSELYVQLMEMGCIPDEEICVEISAPLGDPMSIKVSGYHLSLRKAEAEKIWVEICD
ncbi:MAG: ferrous iron transport protein A [Chitinophagaceae bacterium]|nr:ferrous iron transport protein A [Chitinophagaceae bacterium]